MRLAFYLLHPSFFQICPGMNIYSCFAMQEIFPLKISVISIFFELPLNQYAETYSTGMQKKLAIIGMLLQKNEVFILDEPFNGLDIFGQYDY